MIYHNFYIFFCGGRGWVWVQLLKSATEYIYKLIWTYFSRIFTYHQVSKSLINTATCGTRRPSIIASSTRHWVQGLWERERWLITPQFLMNYSGVSRLYVSSAVPGLMRTYLCNINDIKIIVHRWNWRRCPRQGVRYCLLFHLPLYHSLFLQRFDSTSITFKYY